METVRAKAIDLRRTALVVILLSALLFSVLVFSSFFVACESIHDCSGEHCPICIHMDLCEGLLKNVGDGFVAFVQTALFAAMCGVGFLVVSESGRRSTPVTFKDRMNR